MNISIDTRRRIVWLSYEFLLRHNVPKGTINWWSTKDLCDRIYIDGRAFLNYDTIPEPTRRKLPSKEEIMADYHSAINAGREAFFLGRLQDAYSGKGFVKWIEKINEAYEGLTSKKITEFARRASVFERILEIADCNTGRGVLEALHTAYDQLYPGNYRHKSRFCMALSKARNEGVLSVAVDKRAIIKRTASYGSEHQYLAEFILSHNKAFNVTTAYDKFCEACIDQNYKIPSFSWFKSYYSDNYARISRNRYGESLYQNKDVNYAKIIPALYAGDQWQIDGWLLPIYCWKRNEKGGKEYFFRYNLFTVMDAHSRKIIGFDIAESENTENILHGLERAVRNTGTLPFEIVADNHSFNKTKEAGSLKARMEALGTTWTVDSNPKRKAILERSFRMLGENHFKQLYGYIGQGIKSRVKNGITQQELKDLYTKPENMLSYEQVCAVTCTAVYQYNNSIRKNLGESPVQRFEASLQPHSIKIDNFAAMSLFHREADYKVSNGQITIQRGMHRYEYQLPAKYAAQYSGKRVNVRYYDFEQIYLYDIETDAPICCIGQKPSIHGALANQTDQDRAYLMQNKGRIKGIDTHQAKQKEDLFDAANSINPNIYEAANKVTSSKDVLKIAKQTYDIRLMLAQQGIYADRIASLPQIDEMLDKSLKPRKPKENKHPFAVRPDEIKTIVI